MKVSASQVKRLCDAGAATAPPTAKNTGSRIKVNLVLLMAIKADDESVAKPLLVTSKSRTYILKAGPSCSSSNLPAEFSFGVLVKCIIPSFLNPDLFSAMEKHIECNMRSLGEGLTIFRAEIRTLENYNGLVNRENRSDRAGGPVTSTEESCSVTAAYGTLLSDGKGLLMPMYLGLTA
jgi:hypothetical protein